MLVGVVPQLARPLRWKVFKVLGISDQNGISYKDFDITEVEFSAFLERNTNSFTKDILVPENNGAMSASYLMVDPAGRFFDNSAGKHTYSEPICEVGVKRALMQTTFDYQRYLIRGGAYEW